MCSERDKSLQRNGEAQCLQPSLNERLRGASLMQTQLSIKAATSSWVLVL